MTGILARSRAAPAICSAWLQMQECVVTWQEARQHTLNVNGHNLTGQFDALRDECQVKDTLSNRDSAIMQRDLRNHSQSGFEPSLHTESPRARYARRCECVIDRYAPNHQLSHCI